MARVNRYTQIQPGNYNPMSLQELMLVPAYKRNEHDKLLEAASTIETGIAQADPLALHNEVARKEQERLYNNINKQVDLLNSEGFNPSTKSQFLKLNKDYQQSISPTGMLGRINEAKKVLNQNKNSYIENATKMGYSPEAILANWQDFENKYIEDFTKNGNVQNIGNLMAPNYYDYIEEGQKLFKEAGISASDITTGSGTIVSDKKGQYVVNSKNRKVNENNIKQLQAAVDFLNNRILNPNSDAHKSIIHQRKTPEQAIKELTGLADVYVKSKTGSDTSSSTNSFSPAKEAADTGNLFLNHMLKGTTLKSLDPKSPLNYMRQFNNAEFDKDTGNIIQGSSKYATYEDKLEAFKKQNNVRFDNETNQWVATPKAAFSAGVGAPNKSFPIPKDPHHLKSDLDLIRNENPALSNLSDEILIDRLNKYNKHIESEYISSITLPNTNYEYLNDRLFGNRKGKGENSTGIFLNNGATINGEQLDATEVIDELGYNNTKEFKEEGNPSIQGYVIALGKWHVSVQDKDGQAVDLFVEDINEIKNATALSKVMTEDAFKGKAFSVVDKLDNGQSIYFVNDFVMPKLVVGKTGAQNAAQIQETTDVMTMPEIIAEEKANLANNPIYRSVIGIKDE